MKILFILVGALLCFGSAVAQNSAFDKSIKNIDQSTVTSGIIYDRVTPLADLTVFNMPAEKPHNVAGFRFFKQALFELHKASNYTKFIAIAQLENTVNAKYSTMNVVPIGIINTPFQMLNYNPEDPRNSGLILKDSLFEQVPGVEPFLNSYALVVAPLKNVMQGEQIIYKFSDDLIFNNGDLTIVSLNADFGDGNSIKIIENGTLIVREVIIENNKSNGVKKLNFSVEMSNGFTFITRGSIYTIQGDYVIESGSSQPPVCSSSFVNANGLIANFKTDYVEASEAFQGLNENTALKGQIEARVFYHNNSNTQAKLLKPIILVDGFDPGDNRKIDDCDCERIPACQEEHQNKITEVYSPNEHESFVELMDYKDEADIKLNLITELRSKGFDVIIVNHPTYVTNGKIVDGGADFIERNAMAFVQLTKEVNARLVANGSTEKIVVMGPSMGGQITRFALAYMEKKFAETGAPEWKHNTSIWVAFDSPNHGANVPIGDQALIMMLAKSEVNEDASKSFNKLQSVAANEMLINYLQSNEAIDNHVYNYNNYDVTLDSNYINASTVSQGMPTNAGNPYFQEHYNNQFNNGLPNSKGFPVNVRKLAIVNGSLSGATFGNGYEKILDVRLSKQICLFSWNIFGWTPSSCFNSKLFSAETYTIPTYNAVVAETFKLPADVHKIYTSASSIRGNLDNIPGGSIDATGVLYSSITGAPLPGARSFWQNMFASISSFYAYHIGGTAEWETRALKPDQCFIPTYSSIGIKNPNQSWSNPLNRNLKCADETYFDSYFGESTNTLHVSLNYKSVNWLMKEIGDSTHPPTPQAPYFPIEAGLLTGASVICENTNNIYQFSDTCKVPSSATWSVSPNLQIVSSTSYSVTLSQISIGQGTITATFQNGQTFTKAIWVGKPSFTFEYNYFQPQPVKSTLCVVSSDPNFTLAQQGVTNVTFPGATIQFGDCIRTNAPFYKEAIVTNACGSTILQYDCYFCRPANNNVFKIYPNPSNNIVNIDLRDENNQPEKESIISGELFDMMGQSRTIVVIKDSKATFSVGGLTTGIYVLKIYINDQIETHQIAVE